MHSPHHSAAVRERLGYGCQCRIPTFHMLSYAPALPPLLHRGTKVQQPALSMHSSPLLCELLCINPHSILRLVYNGLDNQGEGELESEVGRGLACRHNRMLGSVVLKGCYVIHGNGYRTIGSKIPQYYRRRTKCFQGKLTKTWGKSKVGLS